MLTDKGRKRRLIVMFVMTFLYMIFEIVIGVRYKCMSLMADAFHMLSDVIALTVGYISITLSPKAWKRSTFGWARAEVLGALINGVFLLALCFSLFIRAVEGFIEPSLLEQPLWVLCVGAGGLLMNLIGLAIFHESDGHGHSHSHGSKKHHEDRAPVPRQQKRRGSLLKHSGGRLTRLVPAPAATNVYAQSSSVFPENQSSHEAGSGGPGHMSISVNAQPDNLTSNDNDVIEDNSTVNEGGSKKNMNLEGVYLHLIADTLGSIVVVIVAGVVYFTETRRLAAQVNGKDVMPWILVEYLDPVLTVLILILICSSTVPLVQEASLVLLQTTPASINIMKLKKKLLEEVSGVIGIHEFHVWQLAGDRIVGSIHIRCCEISDYQRVVKCVKAFFHRNGIHSITVQAEFETGSQELLFGPRRENEDEKCLLLCPPGYETSQFGCGPSTCCGKLDGAAD